MKKIRLITGLISVLMPLLMLLPQTAHATGEVYYFTDETNQTVVGTNGTDARGIFTDDVRFTIQAPDANNTYFGGKMTIQCNNIAQPIDLTLAIPKSDYEKTYPTPGTITTHAPPGCTAPQFDTTIKIAKDLDSSGVPASQKDASKCDQDASTWFTCPLIDKLSVTISNLATNFIRPLLELNTVSRDTTPKLYTAWENIRNLADVGFVFVFLYIIFANIASVRVDQYTIRKMIPRLVAAAILVQFSFMICSFVVDLGNVLGSGIQGVILGNFDFAQQSSGAEQVVENISLYLVGITAGTIAILAAWPILIPMLLGIFVSILAFFFIMSIRFLVIAILIVISPLAFLAWTLPNTEQHYQTWWKSFFRLVMMYPIIMAILAIAGRVNEILAFTGSATSSGGQIVAPPGSQDNVVGTGVANAESLIIGIIRPFLIIATFALITRTYHWAGTIVASSHGRFLQFKGGRTGKNWRQSEYYQRQQRRRNSNQRALVGNVANTSGIKSLTNSKSPIKRGAGQAILGGTAFLAAKAPASSLERQRQLGTDLSTDYKQLDDLQNSVATLPNLQTAFKASYGTRAETKAAYSKLATQAPELLPYLKTDAGRAAIAKRLADFDNVSPEMLIRARDSETHKGEYGLIRNATSKQFSTKPAAYLRTEQEGTWNIQDRTGAFTYTRSHLAGDTNVEVLSGIVGSKGTGDLGKMHDDFYKMLARSASDRDDDGTAKWTARDLHESRDVVASVALKTSSAALGQGFDTNKPNTAFSPVKRLSLIKSIKLQPDLYEKGNGLEIKRAIENVLDKQGDLHRELLQDAGVPESQITSLLEQKRPIEAGETTDQYKQRVEDANNDIASRITTWLG